MAKTTSKGSSADIAIILGKAIAMIRPGCDSMHDSRDVATCAAIAINWELGFFYPVVSMLCLRPCRDLAPSKVTV